MNPVPSRLILAAAVAAVGLVGSAGFAYAGGDDDTCASSCSSSGTKAPEYVSADDPAAAQQAAPADELLVRFKAVEIPRPDQAKVKDPAYVKEFRVQQNEALKTKAALGREFVMAYPGHAEAGRIFKEIMPMRLFALHEEQQVSEDITTLLAREDVSDELRKTLEIAHVQIPLMTGGPDGDTEGAWTAVQKLNEKYPGDEQIAGVMAQVAEASEGETRVERLKQTLATFPDSKALKYTKGKLRQAEGIGKPFEISFTDAVSGEQVTSEDLKGKIVVVDFWATWCGPCIAEMPTMKKLYDEYKDKGVEFVGVSLDAPEDQGGKEALLKYVKENDVTWPQYYQGKGWESEFSGAWGINGIPALFIVDAEGNLYSTEARGKLETLIPELLSARDGGEAKTAGAKVDGEKQE